MPEPNASARDTRDARTGSPAAAARIAQQQTWVDLQVERAMERGDFDDLPGRGKPIEGLGERHDPEWWLKKLVERERIAVLPASLQLRKDDAELDALLDTMAGPDQARAAVEEFNARVIQARYGIPQGPPLITMPRDVDATLAAWAERRAARRADQPAPETDPAPGRRSWWRRGRRT